MFCKLCIGIQNRFDVKLKFLFFLRFVDFFYCKCKEGIQRIKDIDVNVNVGTKIDID